MENFFDLRELLIALLRRLKLIIVITLVFSIAWAGVRFVPLVIDYLTYDNKVDTIIASSFLTAEEQPYYYEARRTLYIPPKLSLFGEIYWDETSEIARAYLSLRNNKEVLQPMLDEFFEEVKRDDALLKQKMVDCNYRTRMVFNQEFNLMNFYNCIKVESTDHIVHIYCSTGNSELSERMVARLEELLSDYVAEICGDYEYTITEGQVGFWLPTATEGLIPKTNTSLTQKTVVGVRPELLTILKQAIKGAAIGFVAGFGLSILLIFFFKVAQPVIQSSMDIKTCDQPVLSIYKSKSKKKFLGFVDNWIRYLEGSAISVTTLEQSCDIVLEKLQHIYSNQSVAILLTGTIPLPALEAYSLQLQKCADEKKIPIHFIHSACILNDANTIAKSKDVDGVILLEQINQSMKMDISRELDEFKYMNKTVRGFILMY